MTDFRHPDPTAALAFALFEGEVDPAAVAAVLVADLPDARVTIEEDSGIVVVEDDEVRLFASVIAAAIPNGEAEGAAANNAAWPDGPEVVARHSTHVLVTAMPITDGVEEVEGADAEDGAGKGGSGSCGCGGCTCGAKSAPDSRWDSLRSNLSVISVAGSLAGMTGCLGIYSGAQGVVYSTDYYREVLDEAVADEGLPIPVLVYLLCGPLEGGGSAAFTNGLRALGHAELEFSSTGDDLEALFLMMYNVVHYVLASGAALNPGETLGYTEEQKLEITVGPGTYVAGDVLHVRA